MAVTLEKSTDEEFVKNNGVNFIDDESKDKDCILSDQDGVVRAELLKLVINTGIKSSVKKSPLLMSISEPSSPRKLFRERKSTLGNEDNSSTGSDTTITSEDCLSGSREFNSGGGVGSVVTDSSVSTVKSPPSLPPVVVDDSIPSLIVSKDEETDYLSDFRPRTGSHFYHESFGSSGRSGGSNSGGSGAVLSVGGAAARPSMYLPATFSSQQFSFNLKQHKKQKGLFNRLRHSFNKHKPVISDKTSNNKQQRKWIDHEDELDPVSRPSYFRHIGHVIKAGPGMMQTIELNRPPEGKFGVYIAQGIDPVDSKLRSIFVSRFYQENMGVFYGSLLRPGDEILAINGHLIRDVTVNKVIQLLADLQTVQLTILPFNTSTKHNGFQEN